MTNPTRRGLRLERVFGLTAKHNSCYDTNPVTGDVAFPAGCIIVIYSPKRNKQRAFMRTARAVSCLRYSSDGKYLAVGERGINPTVTVWDMQTHQRVAELIGHDLGVACIAFSPNGHFLATVGFKGDATLRLWDWRTEAELFQHDVPRKIYAVTFLGNGSTFITGGDSYIRFWDIVTNTADNSVQVLEKAPGLMPDYKNATFVDLCPGTNDLADTVFTVTLDGTLISFNPSRQMDKWVMLEADAAFSIHVTDRYVACGCSEGVIRMFEPGSLEYVTTLPSPPPLGDLDASQATPFDPSGSLASFKEGMDYPAATCVHIFEGGTRMVSVYSDNSLFIWDISDPANVGKLRSFLNHSSSVWDAVSVPNPKKSATMKSNDDESSSSSSSKSASESLFASCSSDNTIRIWSFGDKSKKTTASVRDSSAFSKELRGAFYTDVYESWSPSNKEFDIEPLFSPSKDNGVRKIAVSPSGRYIAAGDKLGTVKVFDLTTKLVCFEQNGAHHSEITCLEFSPQLVDDSMSKCFLLASGSTDRVVNIFKCAKEQSQVELVQSLENHSSQITCIKFSFDGKKLLTCGADKTIVMSHVDASDVKSPVFRYKSISTPNGTINGLDIDPTNKYFATAGQDKRLTIWSLVTGKVVRSYKAEAESGEFYDICFDPAGMYAATCSFDKSIRLFDFYSGECIAKTSGHSELITGISFSNDCKRLVSTCSDGCMFVWRLAPEVTSAIRDRLKELRSLSQLEMLQEHTRKSKLRENEIVDHESGVETKTAAESPDRIMAPPSPVPLPADTEPASAESPANEADRNSIADHDTDGVDHHHQAAEPPGDEPGTTSQGPPTFFRKSKLPPWARTGGAAAPDKPSAKGDAFLENSTSDAEGEDSKDSVVYYDKNEQGKPGDFEVSSSAPTKAKNVANKRREKHKDTEKSVEQMFLKLRQIGILSKKASDAPSGPRDHDQTVAEESAAKSGGRPTSRGSSSTASPSGPTSKSQAGSNTASPSGPTLKSQTDSASKSQGASTSTSPGASSAATSPIGSVLHVANPDKPADAATAGEHMGAASPAQAPRSPPPSPPSESPPTSPPPPPPETNNNVIQDTIQLDDDDDDDATLRVDQLVEEGSANEDSLKENDNNVQTATTSDTMAPKRRTDGRHAMKLATLNENGADLAASTHTNPPTMEIASARSACASSLKQLEAALENSMRVFKEVQSLEASLSQMNSTNSEEDLESSILEVSTVMDDYKTSMRQMVHKKLTKLTEDDKDSTMDMSMLGVSQASSVFTQHPGEVGMMLSKLTEVTSMLSKLSSSEQF